MSIIGSIRSIIGCTKVHNRQSLGESGNGIIGKFKSIICQGLPAKQAVVVEENSMSTQQHQGTSWGKMLLERELE